MPMKTVDLTASQIAKICRYVDWRTSGNIALGTFATVWLISRHIVYVRVCWILFQDIPTIKPYGCYSGINGQLSKDDVVVSWSRLGRPFIDSASLICIVPFVKWAFLSMLLVFEAMSIVWFKMIVQTVTRAFVNGYSDDVRSDEDEDEAEESVDLK
jgi:acyl-CoA-dependent ceramide synthase